MPPSLAEPAIVRSSAAAAGASPAASSYSPRSPAKIGHARPSVLPLPGSLRSQSEPSRVLAVAVEAEAVPERSLRRLHAQLLVDDRDGVDDRRVARRLDPEPHQLQEAGVDDGALVGSLGTAVADRVGRRRRPVFCPW